MIDFFYVFKFSEFRELRNSKIELYKFIYCLLTYNTFTCL